MGRQHSFRQSLKEIVHETRLATGADEVGHGAQHERIPAERLDIAKAVTFLRSEVAATDDWSWRRVQGMLGLPRDELDAIGMGPVKPSDADAPDEETPTLTDANPEQTSTVVEPYPSEADKYGG